MPGSTRDITIQCFAALLNRQRIHPRRPRDHEVWDSSGPHVVEVRAGRATTSHEIRDDPVACASVRSVSTDATAQSDAGATATAARSPPPPLEPKARIPAAARHIDSVATRPRSRAARRGQRPDPVPGRRVPVHATRNGDDQMIASSKPTTSSKPRFPFATCRSAARKHDVRRARAFPMFVRLAVDRVWKCRQSGRHAALTQLPLTQARPHHKDHWRPPTSGATRCAGSSRRRSLAPDVSETRGTAHGGCRPR